MKCDENGGRVFKSKQGDNIRVRKKNMQDGEGERNRKLKIDRF